MARWVLNVLVIYKELWLTEIKSFPFPFYFFFRSVLSYKENIRFGDSKSERGEKEMWCVWEKERVWFESVSAHLCPAVSCLSNRMTSMRKWNYGHRLNTGSAVSVCVYVRERWWLVGACWLWTMSSKQTHSCRASVMRPIYSSPLSAGRHAAPHFRFYCIASVSPSRGAHRGAVATAVIWPGKVKFTLWQAIAKAWNVKSGRVLRPFHV